MIFKKTAFSPVYMVFLLIIISSRIAFAQPSNDNCFGAIALTPSSSCIPVNGTVANATQSLTGCTGTADDDVWYSFVANQTSLGVQVTGSTGFNPVIQIFSGGCSSMSSLACGNASTSTNELTSYSAFIIGVTYWVRVYHFGATYPTNPAFIICVSPQAQIPNCATSTPAGNTCSQASLICEVNGYCGSTAAVYTADYWPELNTAFCGSIENNSFIQFVASSSIVSLNVWVTSSQSNLGIQVMIFSATNCSGPVVTHSCVSPLAPSTTASPVTVSGLTPGNTYFMMIDGYAGDVCNYVIGVNSGIQVSGNISTSATNVCLGTPVTLIASGGNGLYAWTASPDLSDTSGSVVIALPTTQGAHVYTMTTNSNNPLCPSTSLSNVTINAFAPPTPNAGIDDTVCLGSPIYLNGIQTSTVNSMSWQFLTTGISPTPTVAFAPNFSSLTPTVTVNQPGLYRFILRETNSVCGINRDTVNVLVMNPQQSIQIVEPSCFGLSDGEIHIVNADANEFSFDNGLTWQTDSIGIGFNAGTYTVCSRNYLGCSVCSNVTVTNPIPMQFEVSNDTLICENGTTTLIASALGSAPIYYHWDFTNDQSDSQTVSPTSATQYTVYAENDFGCITTTETISVTIRASITGTISPNPAICPNYPTDIYANASGGDGGPYAYDWSTGFSEISLESTINVNPIVTEIYTVTISDACESTPLVLTTEVEVLPLPIPLIYTEINAMCEPAIFSVYNLTDISTVDHLYWEISDGQIFIDQEQITTEALSAGLYNIQLIVTTPQGCVDSMTFYNFLTVHPKPNANFIYSPNPVLMFNTTVQLTNYTVNSVSYQWFIESGNPSYSESKNVKTSFPDGTTGEYEVMLIATSEFDCKDTIIKNVLVLPEVLLYAPNAFTPDGDEHNQNWGIFIEGVDVYDFELILYNRWGEIIWESHDPSAKWDGTFGGRIVEQGIYTWVIRAKNIINDDKLEFNGFVNVLK